MKKADNFNPGKWLVENKITTQSRLNEDNLQEDTNDKTYQIKYHTTKNGKKEVGFKTNKDKSFYWVSIGLEDITKKNLEKKGYKLVENKITTQSRLNEKYNWGISFDDILGMAIDRGLIDKESIYNPEVQMAIEDTMDQIENDDTITIEQAYQMFKNKLGSEEIPDYDF